ncbi:hypothetical protein ACR6C2_17975 [Streptomyces sp. INA 01156]
MKFVWSINSTNYAGYACAWRLPGHLGRSHQVLHDGRQEGHHHRHQAPAAGPNTLYVKSVDAAGNISPIRASTSSTSHRARPPTAPATSTVTAEPTSAT